MFKFDFSLDPEEKKSISDVKNSSCEEDVVKSKKLVNEDLQWKFSEQILISDELLSKYDTFDKNINEYSLGDVNIKCVNSKYIFNQLMESNSEIIKHVESNHSDLVTAEYEGGLKIWECTRDMLNFVIKKENIDFTNKVVLDLGCGAGLLGILLLLKNAIIHFQDYNKEVLNFVTIPNILNNNFNKEAIKKNCRFYSGDWGSFLDLTNSEMANEDMKYDYIFTVETIYNTDNYEKLYLIFKHRLKKSGVMYPFKMNEVVVEIL